MNILKTYIIICCILFCCDSKNNIENKQIEVPKSAFKAGNDKYEHWFNIDRMHTHKNNAIISIYDVQTGKLILKKNFFKICPIDDLKFIENLEEEIDYYDGIKIYLKDDCYLLSN